MDYEVALWHRLTDLYDPGEAKAIVRWVLDVRFGLSLADILCGKVTQLSADDQTELEKIMLRLEKGEPVQFVLGVADFFGRQFHVEPGVLIPRPETAELCQWIVEERKSKERKATGRRTQFGNGSNTILDIGTGSGCIAITLALEIPNAKVTAWDISDEALRIAAGNAAALGANVIFEHHDILDSSLFTLHSSLFSWDLIVSNPPYIYNKERQQMSRNVLDYEPHEALFAPDEDPALFYKCIARYAWQTLNPDGQLYFELNPLSAQIVADYLQEIGFSKIEIRQDQFNKQRFLKAIKI